MARIRTIKPDAFTSESLSVISVLSRWTFAGLWTYLDDVGLGRHDPRLIKAALFPLDDRTSALDVETALRELVDVGCIHTYNSGGKTYMHAPEFLRHQRINRPTESRLPPCPCGAFSEDSLSPQTNSDDSLTESSLAEGEGKGKGRGGGKGREASSPTSDDTNTPPTKRPPRRCPKHLKDPHPPACGGCADARKDHDAWTKPTLSAKQTKCGDHPDQPALNCPKCAEEVSAAPPENWRKTG